MVQYQAYVLDSIDPGEVCVHDIELKDGLEGDVLAKAVNDEIKRLCGDAPMERGKSINDDEMGWEVVSHVIIGDEMIIICKDGRDHVSVIMMCVMKEVWQP